MEVKEIGSGCESGLEDDSTSTKVRPPFIFWPRESFGLKEGVLSGLVKMVLRHLFAKSDLVPTIDANFDIVDLLRRSARQIQPSQASSAFQTIPGIV